MRQIGSETLTIEDGNSQTGQVLDKRTDSQRAKRRCLILLLQIAGCGGFLLGVLPEDSGAIIVLVWCYMDAEERGFEISFRLALLILLLLIVGFPYYILRTRSNIPALKTLGLAVLFSALFLGLNTIAYELGFWIYMRYVA